MLTSLLLIALGLALLYYGGDFLVTGSVRIARAFKISPFIIGATVIGFGTSAPELAVSIIAAFQGAPELAMGNVIGSNIANVGLVLGITAFLAPLTIEKKRLKEEAPPLVIASFLILVLAWNQNLTQMNGIILLGLLVAYLVKSLSKRGQHDEEIEDEGSYFKGRGIGFQILLIVVGLAMLVKGADWLVEGSVAVARSFGVSEWFIGISIVAVGTSLPEIMSSLIAAKRGHGEMAIGNVFGSNIFNILMVLGTAATIKPLHIEENIHFDLLFTTALTCLLLILIRIEHILSKRDGAILILAYVTYMGLKGMGLA